MNSDASTARTPRDASAASTGGALDRLLDRPLCEGDVAAATAHAASEVAAEERGKEGIVLFGLENEVLALPALVVRRVTAFAPPVRIPNRSGRVLRGVCNVRGELLLCGDLRSLLGLAERAASGSDESRRTMVIGPAGASWAFEVDCLHGIGRIDAGALAAVPLTVEHALGSFARGLAEVEGRGVTVLDGERILAGFKAALA